MVIEPGVNPSAGLGTFEDIGGGWQIHHIEPFARLGNAPAVGVAVEIGLHLTLRREKVEQGSRVFESSTRPRRDSLPSNRLQMMVGHHNGRFVFVPIEHGGKPDQLIFSDPAGDQATRLQGIQEEPIGLFRRQKGCSFSRDERRFSSGTPAGPAQGISVIVVAQEKMKSASAFDEGIDQLREIGIVLPLSEEMGTISVDDDTGISTIAINNLGDDFSGIGCHADPMAPFSEVTRDVGV